MVIVDFFALEVFGSGRLVDAANIPAIGLFGEDALDFGVVIEGHRNSVYQECGQCHAEYNRVSKEFDMSKRQTNERNTTTFTLAGGCFWCLDAVFRQLQGVETSLCGYVGGDEKDTTYYAVATGKTGHAEAVQVTVDETVLSAETLLDIFFLIHDPTTKDQQGADVGSQYRSALFYIDDSQKEVFDAAIQRAQQHWKNPIVTELSPLDRFYQAEPEHQDYFANNPTNGYCSIVIAPKIIKARRAYAAWFKEES